jgi:glycine C-acetyltransferase
MKDVIEAELTSIKDAGTWKSERVITTRQGASIAVKDQPGTILNFCSNNYLGLSSHPEVIQAGISALESRGAGLSSVRFICGTQDIHEELEKKISDFHTREDAILYASCFDANAGIFETMLTEKDAVFSDELNHASIIDGIRLCKAQKHRYKHMDIADLEDKLQASNARMKLIVTDGVFSMDGDITPLGEICYLAEKYNALTFVDECHAAGFLGKTGRGTEEYLNVMGKVDIINNTLGKALGGAAGGYTTGPKVLIDLLRQRSRPYLFSNSLPPSVVVQASKAFDIIMRGSGVIEKLMENMTLFRSRMSEAGFELMGKDHPIAPVLLREASLASKFADEMLSEGIYVIGFSYPVVPHDFARIRVQLSAEHSTEDVEKCIDAFITIGKRKGVVH